MNVVYANVLVVLFFGVALADPALGSDWKSWRGPDREGKSLSTGLLTDWDSTKPKLVWNSKGVGSGYSSVSLSATTIFTTGNFDGGQGVVAVKRSNGKPEWKRLLTSDKAGLKHGYPGARSTPTLDGDLLYVVMSDGTIACLKQSDGSLVWQRSSKKDFAGKSMSNWGFAESPLIDGDWLICTPGGESAGLVALDKKSGKTIWQSASPKGENGKDGTGYSSVVISNGGGVKQYITLMGRGVVGVRAKDGELLWNYNHVANKTANISTVVVDGDYVFSSTGYGTGSGLITLSRSGEGVSAKEIYFLKGNVLQNHHGGFVLLDGYLYLGHKHNSGFPTCVEMKSGKIMWGGKSNRGPGEGSAAVAYADGNLIFRYQNGVIALIAASPKAYKLKGTFTPVYVKGPSWSHPVVVDGLMYLREQDQLMCYDLRK